MSAPQKVRQLLSEASTASLGTLHSNRLPFVTLVSVAWAEPATIVMLLSDLAKHAKYLAAHRDASLLICDDTALPENRMSAARVTLTGTVQRIQRNVDQAMRDVFLRRHPQAAMYADFNDFSIYEFRTTEAHLVAGFGQIQTVVAADLTR